MNNKDLNQLIEQSFGSEPQFQLPDDFAQRITAEVVKRSQWKTDLVEYLYITSFMAFIVAIVAGTYYFVNKEILFQILNTVAQNFLMVIFIVVLINFILFTDRVLLPLLFNRHKIKN